MKKALLGAVILGGFLGSFFAGGQALIVRAPRSGPLMSKLENAVQSGGPCVGPGPRTVSLEFITEKDGIISHVRALGPADDRARCVERLIHGIALTPLRGASFLRGTLGVKLDDQGNTAIAAPSDVYPIKVEYVEARWSVDEGALPIDHGALRVELAKVQQQVPSCVHQTDPQQYLGSHPVRWTFDDGGKKTGIYIGNTAQDLPWKKCLQGPLQKLALVTTSTIGARSELSTQLEISTREVLSKP